MLHYQLLIRIPISYEVQSQTRDEYLAYDPVGKGAERKKFWFHVGNFETPLLETIPGAPMSKKIGRVMDLVASKLSASLKPLQNGRIKESRDLLLCKPSGPASSTSETSCLQI